MVELATEIERVAALVPHPVVEQVPADVVHVVKDEVLLLLPQFVGASWPLKLMYGMVLLFTMPAKFTLLLEF